MDQAACGNVRRALARLRQRWEHHGPTSPFCLAEELEPGVTVGDFCVRFLLSQRTRRHTARDV